jgi:hypothetical protein
MAVRLGQLEISFKNQGIALDEFAYSFVLNDYIYNLVTKIEIHFFKSNFLYSILCVMFVGRMMKFVRVCRNTPNLCW